MNHRIFALGLLAALPAMAQDGFDVGVGLGYMKANVASPQLAAMYSATASTSVPYIRNVYAEYGDHTPLSLHLGYTTRGNTFALDIQSSNGKKTMGLGTLPGYAGGAIVLSLPYEYETKLTANLYDLTWGRTLSEGGNGTWGMILGVRVASFENRARQTKVDGATWTRIESRTKTDTYGLLAGVNYRYPIAAGLSLGANLKVAYVQGDDDGRTTISAMSLSTPMEMEGKTKNNGFVQSELGVELAYRFNDMIQATLGYRHQDFGKVNGRPQPGYESMMIPVDLSGSKGGWGLSGLNLGVSFHF